MKKKIQLVVLLGPTASGKTETAIHLARKINGEIISADSRQLYRGMDIGTAKPAKEQQKEIPHHLIDIVNPDEDFTVHDFREMAREKIRDIQIRKKIPLVVGGTGFYIRALVENMAIAPVPPQREFRESLRRLAREKGAAALHEKLKTADPEEAQKIHPNDVKKIIRALEIVHVSGKQKSSFREQYESTFANSKIFGLLLPREILYERINRRADTMLEAGLVDEVKKLLSYAYDETCHPMTGIGYRQIIGFLRGEYPLDHAVELMKRDTRHFAKRQLAYFKLIRSVQWIHAEGKSPQEIAGEISSNFFPL